VYLGALVHKPRGPTAAREYLELGLDRRSPRR
jgi:hypothetical protein